MFPRNCAWRSALRYFPACATGCVLVLSNMVRFSSGYISCSECREKRCNYVPRNCRSKFRISLFDRAARSLRRNLCSFPQANTLRPYLNAIRGTLDAALCLRNFPSQTVERHNKPEVETRYCMEVPVPSATLGGCC